MTDIPIYDTHRNPRFHVTQESARMATDPDLPQYEDYWEDPDKVEKAFRRLTDEFFEAHRARLDDLDLTATLPYHLSVRLQVMAEWITQSFWWNEESNNRLRMADSMYMDEQGKLLDAEEAAS